MFDVVLTNGAEDLVLRFKVRNTAIAHSWFEELQQEFSLYEDDRFSNWGNTTLVDKLNSHIDVINSYDNLISIRVSNTTTQQDLNYLHKFFEDLRGEVSTGTEWFLNAPVQVQDSVQQFNILIHQLESELRTKGKHPTLVVTFKDRPRIKLSDRDCEQFTYRWQQGAVYINYCQVGKTVLDAFKDHDDIAEAIRPQTHYSADFMIKFGPTTNWFMYMARVVAIKLWLLKRDFKFKFLNLGMIPVADLQTKVEHDVLLKFNKVKRVTCIK